MQTIQIGDSSNFVSLKTAATPKGNDDEKSIAASQLDRVWNDHINTIQFGDYTSKATRPSGYGHSRARSKRLNQDNLSLLSKSNDGYSQVRNSHALLNEDLVTKSNLFSKDGRNSKKTRVKTAVTRNGETLKSRLNSVVSNDNLSNASRNKSFYTQTMSNMNEATMLKIVLTKLKSYQVSP